MYHLLAHLADPAEFLAGRPSPVLRIERGGAAAPRRGAVTVSPHGEDEGDHDESPFPRRLIVR